MDALDIFISLGKLYCIIVYISPLSLMLFMNFLYHRLFVPFMQCTFILVLCLVVVHSSLDVEISWAVLDEAVG